MARTIFKSKDSDLVQYPSLHLAVDLVLVTVEDDCLKVLSMERFDEPFAGHLVLPGGFVHPGEALDVTARRVMSDKTGPSGIPVEQLYTFSEPARDPRGWVVSVAYMALVSAAQLHGALEGKSKLRLVAVNPAIAAASAQGRKIVMLNAVLLGDAGEAVRTGFDHAQIIAVAIERLRGKPDYTMIVFGLLPGSFTLFELQRIHELTLGRSVNKPHFRSKMLRRTFPDGRQLVAAGEFSRSGRHRQAKLYRLG